MIQLVEANTIPPFPHEVTISFSSPFFEVAEIGTAVTQSGAFEPLFFVKEHTRVLRRSRCRIVPYVFTAQWYTRRVDSG